MHWWKLSTVKSKTQKWLEQVSERGFMVSVRGRSSWVLKMFLFEVTGDRGERGWLRGESESQQGNEIISESSWINGKYFHVLPGEMDISPMCWDVFLKGRWLETTGHRISIVFSYFFSSPLSPPMLALIIHIYLPPQARWKCSLPSALWVCPLKLWQQEPLVARFICCSPASKSAVKTLPPVYPES